MSLRRWLGATAGALAGLAAANRFLAARAAPLDPPLDREPGAYRWRGMDVAFTEAGDPADPDVVLVHGIHAAGTGREFVGIVNDLAESRHVLVPDLPGFGRSDRPDLVYSAGLYEAFLRDFLSDVADRPACVATSLSGAYAAAAAETAEVEKLILVCPTAGTRRHGWRHAGSLFRAPLVGTALFNLLTAKPSIRYFLKTEGVYDGTVVPAEDLAYFWRTAHQPGARFAPAAFIGGHLDSAIDLEVALAAVAADVTLVWGRAATTPPLQAGRQLAERADAKLVVIDGARSLPHYEQPEAFLDVLASELAAPEGE